MRVGMIQPRGSAFISLTSIQPESRVITIGAASEGWRPALAWLVCSVVVVEFVIALTFPFGLAFLTSDF